MDKSIFASSLLFIAVFLNYLQGFSEPISSIAFGLLCIVGSICLFCIIQRLLKDYNT